MKVKSEMATEEVVQMKIQLQHRTSALSNCCYKNDNYANVTIGYVNENGMSSITVAEILNDTERFETELKAAVDAIANQKPRFWHWEARGILEPANKLAIENSIANLKMRTKQFRLFDFKDFTETN